MSRKPIQNYAAVFKGFSDQKMGRVPRFLSKVGAGLFTLFFVCEILFELLRHQESDRGTPSLTMQVIIGAAAVGFLGGSFVLALVGVYYIGAQQKMYSFFPAFLYVVKKVALYIFLPAILVACLLFIVASSIRAT